MDNVEADIFLPLRAHEEATDDNIFNNLSSE